MSAMNVNTDSIDDANLVLLYLTLHDCYRAGNGFDRPGQEDEISGLYRGGVTEEKFERFFFVTFNEGRSIVWQDGQRTDVDTRRALTLRLWCKFEPDGLGSGV